MPNVPNIPQGVSEQQPQANQQLNEAVSTMSQMAKDNKALLVALDEILQKTPSYAQHAAREFENLSFELKASLEYLTDAKEAMQAIQSFARKTKGGMFDTKSLDRASKIVEEIKAGQEKVLKLTGKNTDEYKKAGRALEQLTRWQKENEKSIDASGKAIEMNTEQMKKFSKMVEETVGNWNNLNRSLRSTNIGHMTRQVHSMSKAFAEIGIGKGFAARMDKYAAGAEIKGRVAEYKKARVDGNIAAAQEKKVQAQEWVRQNAGRLKLEGPLDFAKGPAREAVAERMGLGGAARKVFLSGVGGEDEAFKHGGGGMLKTGASMVAGAVEGGVGEAAGGLAAAALPLAAAAGVIELLREGFDKQAQQNKDMESSLGKAGLFAQPGIAGFDEARHNLTPATPFTRLGLSFDRNVKIAQALQEGGVGMRELVTGEGGRPAAEGVEGGEDFGVGGFGRYQRIAVGAGRVAGMTDVEGIKETVKLADQYAQTLSQSEDFFIRVAKASSAAGLSTTKYIEIVDEITNAFGRMNKGLDGALGALAEMSKTGRFGAEDLKSYMNFLTAGGPAKGMQALPMNTFLLQHMPALRENIQSGATADLTQTLAAARGELGPMADKLPGLEQLQGPDAQKTLNQLEDALTPWLNTLSESDRSSREKAITLLRMSTMRYAGAQSPTALGLASGLNYGQTPAGLAARNEAAAEMVMRIAKTTPEEFMRKGGAQGLSDEQRLRMTAALQIPGFEGFTEQTMNDIALQRPKLVPGMLAGMEGAMGETDNQKRNDYIMLSRTLLKEAKKFPDGLKMTMKNGKVGLADKDIDALTPDEVVDAIKENHTYLAGIAANTDTTGEYSVKMFQWNQTVDNKDRSEAMEKARMAGLRTQTTGDIIANAFSKWFNDLISITTKIMDRITGTSPGSRAAAQAAISTPEFHKKLIAATESLDKQANEQMKAMDSAKTADEREAASVRLEAIQRKRRGLETTPQNAADVKTLSDSIDGILQKYTGAGKPITAGDIGEEGRMYQLYAAAAKSNQAVTETLQRNAGGVMANLMAAGGTADMTKGSVTYSLADFDKSASKLNSLVQSGAAWKTEDKQAGTITLTTNYYLAEVTQRQEAQNSVTGSGAGENPNTITGRPARRLGPHGIAMGGNQ
jgi:hypothetical protein